MKGDSWVTIASNDVEAWKSLVLAKSLRNVFTSKYLTIGITSGVSKHFKSLLNKNFDAVIPIDTDIEVGLENDYDRSWTKLWCWNLRMWEKCIFIDPNSLVLENPDELFEQYGEFSTFANQEPLGLKGQMSDIGIFVFKPDIQTFENLIEFAKKFGKCKVEKLLESFFKTRNDSSTKTKYIDSYYYENDVGISEIYPPKIIHFNAEPWEKETKNGEMGILVKNAKLEWLKIFVHQVFPSLDSENNCSKEFLMSTIQKFSLPTTNGPKKPLENTNLGNLQDSIAIIGASGRFPGANSLDELWNLLASGTDPITPFPKDRPHTKSIENFEAGFLKCPIDEFDAKFFEISPREASFIDPQQRLLLEVIWESLENASINPQELQNTNTSAFLGIWQQDYDKELESSGIKANEFFYKYLGNAFSGTSGRISHFLGLFGPNISLESGCASSSAAVHLACKSLREGETNLAVVSGANILLSASNPFGGNSTDHPTFSNDFRCKTFDESANGFVSAEACASIVLKKYSAARRDGDKIMGIIRGSALNNDGPGNSFGTPNATAQSRVFQEALDNAGILPSEVSLVEAHGTGTTVGDPIEMSAIGKVYSNPNRTQPLLISSVKTNLGHTESCAGLSGLVKILLSMKHQVIPPHLHLKTLNPKIDLESIPAIIPTRVTEWNVEEGKPRIAALNSFSMTGTNVHIILQEPPTGSNKVIPSITHSGIPQMVQISAKSPEALNELVTRYINYLESESNASEIPIEDIAYHTNVGRANLAHRIALVANNTPQLLEQLQKNQFVSDKIPVQKRKVAFLFTGQGSQYFGMTKDLYEKFHSFKISFDRCDCILRMSLGISLKDILWGKPEYLEKSLYCQPAIFSVEYCLASFWKSFGIKPDYVLGHSVGEFAAAATAGILTLQDAMKLVIQRSKLVNDLEQGEMLVIRASMKTVTNMIKLFRSNNKDMWIDVAAINSGEEVVVSSTKNFMESFREFCLKSGVKSLQIKSNTAFHSRAMDPILQEFQKIASKVKIMQPKCKYISGTLARVMEEPEEFGSDYWLRHLRDTVRFSESVKLLWEECKTLIEIGPQPILLGLTMANIPDSTVNGSLIPSIRKNEEDVSAIFAALSKMYFAGMDINWRKWFGRRQTKLSLPTYPFQREKFWFNLEESKSNFIDLKTPLINPLLGRSIPAPVSERIFTLNYQSSEFPYMNDHKVVSRVILPGAAYIEIMMAAALEIVTRGNGMEIPLVIENVSIESALELEDGIQLQTIASPECNQEEEGSLHYNLSVHKQIQADKWKRYVTGTFKPSRNIPVKTSIDLSQIRKRILYEEDVVMYYKRQYENGIEFGPQFKVLKEVLVGESEILTRIDLPSDYKKYICHPNILDAIVQTYHFKTDIELKNNTELRLPVNIKKFVWLSLPNEMTKELYIYIHWNGDEHDLHLTNEHGVCLGIMSGVDILTTTKQSFLRSFYEEKSNVPNILEEVWIPDSDPSLNRVNPKMFQIPTISSKRLSQRNGSDPNENRLVRTQEALDKCFSYFLIRGVQECEWKWPNVGDIIKLEDWPSHHPIELHANFMEVLMKEGYLSKPNPDIEEFKVSKELLSLVECEMKINELLTCIEEQDEPSGRFCRRCERHFNSVLKGEMTATAYMFPKDPHEYGVDKFNAESGLNNFLSIHLTDMLLDAIELLTPSTNPGMLRILEVGAGSGASSALLLKKLEELGIAFHYTFTDLSQSSLSEASKKFANIKNMTYGVLNVEEDPLPQGYTPESFDIILAANVIHATKNITQSLKYLNMLLTTNGMIALGEAFIPTTFTSLSFGFLDGWWRFNDFRKSSPLLDSKTWEKCLYDAGFEETNSIAILDGRSGGVIGRKTKVIEVPEEKSWLIFSDDEHLEEDFISKLETFSRETTIVKFDTNVKDMELSPTCAKRYACKINPKLLEHFALLLQDLNSKTNIEGIIYIWTGHHEDIPIQERQQIYCGGLLHLCQALLTYNETKTTKPKINLITKGLHSINDEAYGSIDPSTAWTLLKVLMNEQPEYQVNLFDIGGNCNEEFTQVFSKMWNNNKEPFTLLRDQKKFVQRLVESSKKVTTLTLPNCERFETKAPATNSIMDISISNASKNELKDDEIEINVRACAMNFRDLFIVLKPEGFSGNNASVRIGLDVAGTISSVGGKVNRFKVGDEVITFCSGGYSSHVVVNEESVMRKPIDMTFSSASTLPVAFLTVLYSLNHCAQMTSTDRVLIHAATGGVGLAAIQVAKQVGAEIYATAGSQKKRTYLKSLGIKHIYHSRNTDFGKQILKDTNGQGVTVVLNSLTGPGFKEASLNACSQGARFVEIAKYNIWSEEEVLAMRQDVKYYVVDLASDEPDEFQKQGLSKSIRELEQCLEQKVLAGLPHRTYPLDLIREAFHRFQETKHIGKIVVKIPKVIVSPDGHLEFKHELFNPRSTYLITGGLGGIGMEIAKWMTTTGAKHILLVGRNPPNQTALNQIDLLNQAGNCIMSFQADVGDISQCSKLLDFIKSSGMPPLRGIFHGAGVVSDSTIPNQSWDKLNHTFTSKVYAAWNLHQLTLDCDIEFFVNLSSLTATLGMFGQANYAAANNYLDSLTHYRVSIGLPAQTINFGAWSDVGIAAQLKMGTEGVFGMQSFTPHQGINGIEKIMRENITQCSLVGETDWNMARQFFKLGNYFGKLQVQNANSKSTDENGLEKIIEKVKFSKPDERLEQIEIFIERLLKFILRLPENEKIDKDQNFGELGIDSLMAMETKNNLQKVLKHKTLSITTLDTTRTIRRLSEYIASLMSQEDQIENTNGESSG